MAATGSTNLVVDDHPEPLKIIIIGAGIGGISAAIALRRNGHTVELYEQSRFANEVGAAIHLAPNGNGLLRRWGIRAEEFGGTVTDWLVFYSVEGKVLSEINQDGPKKVWQHPWHLSHRVSLHDKLKNVATSEEGPGTPAKLHTASKVVQIDPTKTAITLADGTVVTGDVMIGADGVYSQSRNTICGKDMKLESSGQAAYRYLVPRETVEADPETAQFAEKKGALLVWYGKDRRIVMYPCVNDTMFNYVLIHPEAESHAASVGDEWNKTASVDQMLKVYNGFGDRVRKLLSKAPPTEVKVWQLLDMENPPTWVNNKSCLLGDAAHPFTPHLGQGAGQAMEDAAALAVVLPPGTHPDAVGARLKLYEKIRYERAHKIQEYSRLLGKPWVNGKPVVSQMEVSNYSLSHDAFDYATGMFRKWKLEQKPDVHRRMPIAFGVFPGPRQDYLGRPQPGPMEQTFVTTSIKFRTSRTFLENLLPTDQFSFKDVATNCFASLSLTTLGNMAWLGGGGYSHFGLYFHGVQYKKKDGTTVDGTYLSLLFENMNEPILSGREELGMPKLFCDLEVEKTAETTKVKASWRGSTFGEVTVSGLEEDTPESETPPAGTEADILTYRYIPAVGEPGKADAEYAVVCPHADEAKIVAAKVESVARSSSAEVRFHALDAAKLPTLHHITSPLAEMPIYEVVSAKTVSGMGVPDLSCARRIE